MDGLNGSVKRRSSFLAQPPTFPGARAISVRKVGFLTGNAWEQLELPLYCRGRVLFTPGSAAPLLHARNVPTIHDTAIFDAPDGYVTRYGLWYKILGWLLCRTSEKVLTVSGSLEGQTPPLVLQRSGKSRCNLLRVGSCLSR